MADIEDPSGAGGMSFDDHSGAQPHMNLDLIDPGVLQRYVDSQIAADRQRTAQNEQPAAAPKPEDQLIAILNQLAQNGINQNNANLARHDKIGSIPAKYKGVRSDAERFLTGLKLYLSANDKSYDSHDKILSLVFSLCEDKAGEWIQPYMKNMLAARVRRNEKIERRRIRRARGDFDDDDDEEIDDPLSLYYEDSDFLIITFEDFEEKFRETWMSSDPGADARNAIENISQGNSSVSEYYSRFMTIGMQTGYHQVDLRERFRRGLNQKISDTISGWDRPMDTLPKLKAAATKAEAQLFEFAQRRKPFTTPTAPASSNNSWRSKPSTPVAPATSQARTFDRSQGIAPMEVDANAFVCFNCYEEGHAAAQCKNAKQPRREIIWGGERRSKPREQRVAATEITTPAKPEKPSDKSAGKKKESFVEGSSKDGASDQASEVANLRRQMDVMSLQFGQLMSILSKKEADEEADFQ
jgi:hypothetical protein